MEWHAPNHVWYFERQQEKEEKQIDPRLERDRVKKKKVPPR